LSKCEGVILAAALVSNKDIFIKVKAPNKLSFDNKIMEQIQAVPGVKTTQSFIIINEKCFVRDETESKSNQEQNDNLSNVSVWAKQRK